jgi:hypothetical protein
MLIGAAAILAACLAAPLAHLGIDLVGDLVLVRDPYDFVGHPSRDLAVSCAVLLILTAALRFVSLAFDDARRGRTVSYLALEQHVNRVGCRFGIAVVALSLVMLLGMEGLDTVLVQGRIADLDDLLGGSVVLALVVTVPIALLAACGVLRTLTLVAASHRELVAVFGAFLRLLRDPCGTPPTRADADTRPARHIAALFPRRNGKRGPPPLLA